jgi:hypothetical protein
MEAERVKDVGILAMDIYFPPNCVRQVPVTTPHTHSLSAMILLHHRIFLPVKGKKKQSIGSEFPVCSPVSVVKTS